jgi:Coenzyme PQQ synthesis protein D (PqqD)
MRYRPNDPQVINETIDGEAVMINLATGSYYSLDRTGSDVWALVSASLPVDDIVEEIGRRYDGDAADIRRGVESLLAELAAEELVVPAGEGDPLGTRPDLDETPAPRTRFGAPRLEKFTDMQDLILLDPVHEVSAQGWPHQREASGR